MPPVAAAFAAMAATTATVAQIGIVISTVGAGLSVVGKVVGDNDLMKIGGIMGLAGGVTSLAGGAMGAASAAEGVASAAEGVAGAAEAAGGIGEAVTGAMDSGVGFGEGAASMFDKVAQGATTGLDTVNNGMNSPNSFSDSRFASQQSNGLLGSSKPINAAENIGSSVGESQQPAFSDARYGAQNAPKDTSSTGIKDWFDKQDARTKTAILQMGGKALEGVYSGWSQEQKSALERERYNLTQSNANAQPTVGFKPVAQQTRPVGGLLNVRAA